MVAIFFENSKDEIYWEFDLLHKQVSLHIFFNGEWVACGWSDAFFFFFTREDVG